MYLFSRERVLTCLTVATLAYCSTATAELFETCFSVTSEDPKALAAFKDAIDKSISGEKLECSYNQPHPKHTRDLSYSCTKGTDAVYSAFGKAFEATEKKYQMAFLAGRTIAAAGNNLQIAKSDDYESVLRMTTTACLATCVTNTCGFGVSYCWKPNAICKIRC